jgi:ATP-dependent RNA helicase RhlE
MSFANLGLSAELVRAVTEHGYTVPTPIQTQAIPPVLAGGDVLGGAQTGTGKTAAFVLPILQRLATRPPHHVPHGRKPVRALILAPTRELAAQIEESVRVYGKYSKQTSTAVYGGVGIGPQIIQLKRGVDILVATPGRLLDHHQQRTVDFSRIEILVLDEADRMLDMGFIHDIKRILAQLPRRRQNLLFSATFSNEIRALADNLLNAPALIEVAPRNSTVEIINQKVHPVERDRKRGLLSHLIKTNSWHQVLVFTRTKRGANRLAQQLNRDGITTLAIHGNKSQGARTRALSEFKNGGLQVLCATDIAARGIDIDQLPHVVNYDLPNVPEDYVHRIGRTGRAGAGGEAISLVSAEERGFLRDIERLIKRKIPEEVITGFKWNPPARAEPAQYRHEQGPGQGQRGNGANGHPGRKSNGGGHPHRAPDAARSQPQHAKGAGAHMQHGRDAAARAKHGRPNQQPARTHHAAPTASTSPAAKPRILYRFDGRRR